MNNKLLTFLGKDSGFGEKNNSAYIVLEDKLVLIDCGFTVFEDIKKKFDLSNYSKIEVIITHLHNDHAGSLSQLILYSWFIYNKKVTVYTKCINMKKYLEITGTPSESYEIKDGNENLKFIKTEHVDYLDAYGFELKVNNRKIVYTGDTKTIEPFLPYIDECSELYIDVSKYGGAHLKIDDVSDILNGISNRGIYVNLMHIDDWEYIKKFGFEM